MVLQMIVNAVDAKNDLFSLTSFGYNNNDNTSKTVPL